MTNIAENIFFFNKDISNLKIAPISIEHAYLAILDNKLDAAVKIFSEIDSPRAIWGYILATLLKNGLLVKNPTFFQIRNFFEIDVDFLIKNNRINYVEQLLGALEIFSTINQEIYKFAGRVMYENGLNSLALKYMEESKKIYYNDPELHFMLANYYYKTKQPENADFYIEECLRLLPNYYPAEILKNKIEDLHN